MNEKITYWRVHVEQMGYGGLHETYESAREELRLLQQENPGYVITLDSVELSSSEFEELEEFTGF